MADQWVDSLVRRGPAARAPFASALAAGAVRVGRACRTRCVPALVVVLVAGTVLIIARMVALSTSSIAEGAQPAGWGSHVGAVAGAVLLGLLYVRRGGGSRGFVLAAAATCVTTSVVTALSDHPDRYLLALTAVLVASTTLLHLSGERLSVDPLLADHAPVTRPSSAPLPDPLRELGRDLDRAVAARRLEVAYQPVVDVRTGRPVAAEALARWTHPRHGPVPPSEFVPLAERRGSVGALGRLVLDQAVHTAAEWHRAGYAVPVSVNVSVPQLEDPRFPGAVAETLGRHGLPSNALVLEVTESVLVSDFATARHTLDRLRELGVAIALDDFGTGYCSLAYLQLFPADVLKVDRELVAGAAGDPHRTALLRAIAAMAKSLGLNATAEGAESREEALLLDDLGFGQVQSFVYGAPMAREEFRRWLAAQRKADERDRFRRSSSMTSPTGGTR